MIMTVNTWGRDITLDILNPISRVKAHIPPKKVGTAISMTSTLWCFWMMVYRKLLLNLTWFSACLRIFHWKKLGCSLLCSTDKYVCIIHHICMCIYIYSHVRIEICMYIIYIYTICTSVHPFSWIDFPLKNIEMFMLDHGC